MLQISMCSVPLRELSNPGASGSIFYLTEDDEFIIKTVQHKEGEFLQKLLPGYYMVSLVYKVHIICCFIFMFTVWIMFNSECSHLKNITV
jgi:hypothetical protein